MCCYNAVHFLNKVTMITGIHQIESFQCTEITKLIDKIHETILIRIRNLFLMIMNDIEVGF